MVAKAIAKLLKEGAKKGSKKVKDARSKVDEAFTPKKLKEKEAELKRTQREKTEKIKKETKSDDPVVRAGSETKAARNRRLAKNKREREKLKKEQTSASRRRQIGTAVGATAIGSGLTAGVVKGVQDKKAREKKAADTAKKEADRKRKSERVDTALSAFAKKSKERTAAKKKKAAEAAAKKRKEAASKVKTSLFGKVTGKGPKDRNITRGGKKLANVTREQLTKLGLDPNKKSDLRKYLNAFDRMGTRPTKKSDLVAGKMMGGMMKRKGMAKGGAMKKKGYAMGGSAKKFPDLSGDGKVTQKDILMGRGVVKKKAGGMMKKKGYASGGMMKKKGYSKGGAVRKSKRGMGAATRGGGAIM